jgi:assimilatory nitrate reductase catalytic subunit
VKSPGRKLSGMAPPNMASPGSPPKGGSQGTSHVRAPAALLTMPGPPPGNVALLIGCDFVLSEAAVLSDVVIPVAQWAEEDSTLTSLEGWALRRRAPRKPPPGVGTDLAVLAEPACRLGITDGGTTSVGGVRFAGPSVPAEPHAVFEELRRATAGGVADYAGVTWERVDAEDGVFWPCPSADRAGTPRLFGDDFPTPDGRAPMIAGQCLDVAGVAVPSYPVRATRKTSKLACLRRSMTERSEVAHE